MSVFSNEFMIIPVREGGFVIRSQPYQNWRDGTTAGSNELYAFTCMQDLLDFLKDHATQYRALPSKDEVNKLK